MKEAEHAEFRTWNEAAACLKDLGTYYQGPVGDDQVGPRQPKTNNQMILVEADEERNFKVSAPPGTYTVIARECAGFKQAV